MSRTLWIDDDGTLRTLDQTALPFERREFALRTPDDCERAIRTMQVRGAPLIGAVGAYGLALALRADASDAGLRRAHERLAAARPTAVNLRWALDRGRERVAPADPALRAQLAWDEAGRICDDDVACNASIGEQGARLLRALAERRAALAGMTGTDGITLNLLTHCNAGRIATIDHGTALAPVYRLHEEGVPVHVWVDETRPRNQGAALTAWELGARGVPHTVITDNAGGLLMMQGRVDAVIVGCDRVAANGDVANKVGTYLKALAAHDNGVPFYVACPVSTIDAAMPDGVSIPIEERAAREVTHLEGRLDDGSPASVRIVPEGSAVANPAFDITPARLVTALITEHGVCEASASGLRAVLACAARRVGPAGAP
ncbi:MAG: S-methyl-5-thioribose-1-phosphate isomerase [Burkholderiaceae bacterium]|nr:S-methyl-5-thioribose-1-phosphate isomerase [Burkholderiaceae bacterium]